MNEAKPQPKRAKIFLIAIVAAIGGFMFGYDVSMISGAILFMEKYFHLTAAQKGFAMTSAGYGVLGGLLLAGPLSDSLGRRKAVFLAALLFGASAVGTALPKTMLVWNIFRIIGGVGGGIALVVSPLYISEVSPARIRGRLVMTNQIAIVVAILAASIVAYGLAPVANQWRWMFASVLPPVLIVACCLWLIPESPRWLLQKGRVDEAERVLTSLEGPEVARREVDAIQGSLNEETGKLSELFMPGMRMALLVAIAVAVFQQTTGGSTLLFYAPTVFKAAGIHQNQSAIGNTIIVNCFMILFTVIAMGIVDKGGRRPLLLIGALTMAVGQLMMGCMFLWKLPAVFVVVFVVFAIGAYTMSFGPIGWLVMAEVFPTRIRARAMALATFMLQTGALVASGLFPIVSEASKKRFGSEGPTFWLFAGICILAFFFCLKYVPETKGRTLEEIAASWTKKKA